MTSRYDINYQFSFDTISNFINSDKLKAIDDEIAHQNSMKEQLPQDFNERRLGLAVIMKEKQRLNKDKADIAQSFIDSYAELRKLIIFHTLLDKKTDEHILEQYIEYIKNTIPAAVSKLINADHADRFADHADRFADHADKLAKLFEQLFVNPLTIDDLLKKLNETIESRTKFLPTIIFHVDDLISILITHILKMIYTMCSIYNRIFINKDPNVSFVLLFCHGDYHTLKFKCKNKLENYLIQFINGELAILPDAKIDKTPFAIELSYDISNTALPMFTSLDDLSIFMESIGCKIHRVCIISCLNYETYNYNYEKNSKLIRVNKENINDYIDSIYIKPTIPLLTESGELFIYGGNAHNILGDRFKDTFKHIANSKYFNGAQVSIYKMIHAQKNKNKLDGGNILHTRKTRKTRKQSRLSLSLTLNSKPTGGGRKLGVMPVALHRVTSPMQTVRKTKRFLI